MVECARLRMVCAESCKFLHCFLPQDESVVWKQKRLPGRPQERHESERQLRAIRVSRHIIAHGA
jgi:hypothetical protein